MNTQLVKDVAETPSKNQHLYGPMNSFRIDNRTAAKLAAEWGIELPSSSMEVLIKESEDIQRDGRGEMVNFKPHNLTMHNSAGEFWLLSATDKLADWPKLFGIQPRDQEGAPLIMRTELGL